MAKSHYLEKDRLANVIAAIQALGVADQPSATLNRWVAELEASEELTSEQLEQSPIKFADRKKWQSVFEQHPEFFKTYTLRGEPRVLLRWRYSEAMKKEANSGPDGKDTTVKSGSDTHPAGKPLNADQIQALINTAIELHGRELATTRKPDRFRPFLMATIGAAFGTMAGVAIVLLIGLLQHWPTHRLFD